MAGDLEQRAVGDETCHVPTYCAGVRAKKFGGDQELRALSNALGVPIDVYDCTGRRVAFAPEGKQKCPRVTLSFHKHLGPAWHYQIIEKD